MKTFCVLFAIVCSVAAQELFNPHAAYEVYPEWYTQPQERFRREVTIDKKVGEDGRVFGTVGATDDSLYGKGGYEHQFFNDDRGKLSGQVTGTRVLSPYGDSSQYGGGVRWENPNAAASVDISKQIHGGTSYDAAAGGRWPVGKEGDFSLQGTYSKVPGMRADYGAMANFNYRW